MERKVRWQVATKRCGEWRMKIGVGRPQWRLKGGVEFGEWRIESERVENGVESRVEIAVQCGEWRVEREVLRVECGK